MPQTTIQVRKSIRKGSVRVLVGDNFGALVDVGALRNPVFKSLVEQQSIEFDNVDPLAKFVKGKRVQITFDLAEINFENMAILDGGILDLTPNAGSLVAGEVQLVVDGDWAYNKFVKIEHQNGDGTTIVVNSVTAATDGALVADTDYYLGQNEAGEWGIFIVDSATVTTESQNISVDYDYTPNASNTITFADQGNKVLKVMRIINTDEDGKTFKIDIEEGTNFAPISLTFAADSADDVAILPVDFQGNIVEWVDEQTA